MIIRDSYLDKLSALKDINVIKIVTGVRRCGKSTLLMQFRDRLKKEGVKSKNIISYNLEDKANERFTQDKNLLHDTILKRLDPRSRNYVFIDEVQLAPDFEKTLDSLFIRDNIDLYVTGSNANMTSSQLSTLLSGRYVEIEMLPLSFSEFMKFPVDAQPDRLSAFQKYLQYGGFPEVANLLAAKSEAEIPLYLRSIYETVLEKDIKTRRNIRFMDDFSNVVSFMFNNIGSITSPNNIANVLRQENKVIDKATVDGFLSALADCFILYPVRRFDIRGKSLLRTREKYYAVDIGLVNSLLGLPSTTDVGHRLENLVYLELRKRYDGQVWVGKNYDKEIDFVVKNRSGLTEYFQIAETVSSAKTLTRELSALDTRDEYRKTLLTMDLISSNENGIIQKNIIDWLLEEN
ncbi:ATP-binding protein [Candidatus Saccharibacteria bacterium]|nr:ATP-binding protein [Candidatus Saccharibacteria bacterium]